MKNIKDWVAKYNYFDFYDRDGIMEIGHELFRDLIEKCIELEERIEKLEPKKKVSNAKTDSPYSISDTYNYQEDQRAKNEKQAKEILDIISKQTDNDMWVSVKPPSQSKIKTEPIHKPPVIKTKVYKPRKKKTNQTESKK